MRKRRPRERVAGCPLGPAPGCPAGPEARAAPPKGRQREHRTVAEFHWEPWKADPPAMGVAPPEPAVALVERPQPGGLSCAGAGRRACCHQAYKTPSTPASPPPRAPRRRAATTSGSGLRRPPSHSSTRGTRIAESAGLGASTDAGTSGGGSSVRCNSPAIFSSSRPSRRAYWTMKLLVKTPPGSLSSCPASMASRNLDEILSSSAICPSSRLRFRRSRRRVSPMEVIQVVFRPLNL